MKAIFFIGFRGVGKSSLGLRCAKSLGWKFIDSDEVLKNDLGVSLVDYAQAEGMTLFREKEAATIARISEEILHGDFIIALGAGFVDYQKSVNFLKAFKKKSQEKVLVLQITTPFAETFARLAADKENPRVGAYNDAEALEQLFLERKEKYSHLSDIEFENAGASIENTAQNLTNFLREKFL